MLNRLPPLNAIKAFHAVCRHLHLSRAAEELGVTQGAVSKQIIALEDFIGAQLFERTSSGLTLTEEGRALKDTTLSAFDTLITGFARFERRPARSTSIRLSTVASFAFAFLAPRLDRFEAAFPDVHLDILTSTRLLDHTREEVDFSIRYGRGNWDNLVSTPLGSADLIPVGAPGIDPHVSPPRHLETYPEGAWKRWVERTGIDTFTSGPAIVLEDFLVALNAVRHGQGIALLPDLIVRADLQDGQVVALGPPLSGWHQQYHIAMTPQAHKRRQIAAIADWFHREVSPSGAG